MEPGVDVSTYLLPPSAYHSSAWFEQEKDAIFGTRWALVASADELSNAGDYATATIGRAPVVVVRDGDGQLRAFHNLCRHRGMVLLEGCGHAGGSIECFYHQWRYGLDGGLRVVPQRKEQFPDLVAEQWSLLPAAVAEWEGLVFVHPDPMASQLADTLHGLGEHLGSHRPGQLTQVTTLRIEARCNWKLFVENHIDVYHLWYLHQTSLGDFDHTRFEHRHLGANWTSYEPVRNGDMAGAAITRGTTAIAHLDERDRTGIGAHMLFPNILIATTPEFFATYVAAPVAPDRTVIDLRVRAEPDADTDALLDALRSFIDEDVKACERIQAAVESPAFAVGPLAREHERPITDFHAHLLAAMGEQ